MMENDLEPTQIPFHLDPDLVERWLLSEGWYKCRCKKWGLIDDPGGGITCWPSDWAIEAQMGFDLNKD